MTLQKGGFVPPSAFVKSCPCYFFERDLRPGFDLGCFLMDVSFFDCFLSEFLGRPLALDFTLTLADLPFEPPFICFFLLTLRFGELTDLLLEFCHLSKFQVQLAGSSFVANYFARHAFLKCKFITLGVSWRLIKSVLSLWMAIEIWSVLPTWMGLYSNALGSTEM